MASNGTIPPLAKRLGAGISYSVLSLISLAVNIFVLVAMSRKRNSLKNHPFYAIVWYLFVGDLGLLLCQFVVAIPLSFAGEPLYGDGALLITLASLDTFFYNVLFNMSFLIALNRLCIFLLPRLHGVFFEGWHLHVSCLVPWVLAGIWVVTTTVIGCPKVFRHDGFYYMYRCQEEISGFGQVFMTIIQHQGYVCPALILIMYVVIFWYIRRQRQSKLSTPSTDELATERNLLIQAILISLSLEIESLLFNFLPQLTPDMGLYLVSLLLDYLLIFITIVNPVILYIFNPIIRLCVRSMIWGERQTTSKQPRADDTEFAYTNYVIYEVSDDYGNHYNGRHNSELSKHNPALDREMVY
uniref:G-protein coupled receptors family 1 profile domain-containing protein n=1 Tax=Plectus sambesii TaxID=2011161 RepID=A0A914WN61_9BILA